MNLSEAAILHSRMIQLHRNTLEMLKSIFNTLESIFDTLIDQANDETTSNGDADDHA